MGKRRIARISSVLIAAVTLFMTPPSAQAQPTAPFDFDQGHAAFEVVVPLAESVILEDLNGSCASVILRMTSMITAGWFDAIAPYHPTAVGVYSQLGRRPAAERRTHRQRNIAMLYASYRVLLSLMPQQAHRWQAMLRSVGLDPNDTRRDTNTPIGIGNLAGNGVVEGRIHDGMNQLGDEGNREYNRFPYADYLGYEPVNTAYTIRDAGRWQPLVTSSGNGVFTVQQFVTPQAGVTRPWMIQDARHYRSPPPVASNPRNFRAYKRQLDEVLAISAGLTDRQKLIAELFDHKFMSLFGSSAFAAFSNGLDLDASIHYEFMLNVGEFDGAIVAWREKLRHDAVRPFTAARHLYGDKHITAWGGPGQGTVNNITGAEWRSYTGTADHPEYPSGSACFCAIHAEASRRFFGSDQLGWSVTFPRGSSVIEPGVTPARDTTLTFDTWTQFDNTCAMSRVYGGVHFKAAVVEAAKMCRPIGKVAHEFTMRYVNGHGKKLPPATGLSFGR